MIRVDKGQRLLIGGSFTRIDGVDRPRLGRLHASTGEFDRTSRNLPGPNHSVYTLAEQEDGRILVGGHFTSIHGEERARIARLNPDGEVDTTFDERLDGANGAVHVVQQLPDGRILVAGSFSRINGVNRSRIALLQGGYHPPIGITLSNGNVREQRPPDTMVGELAAINPDPLALHTFSLVPGDGDTANELFTVDDTILKTAVTFEEPSTTHSIRLRATQNDGLYFEEVFIIEVDPNLPPTDINITNDTISENLLPGEIVGLLAAIDPDDTEHSFELVDGDGSEGNPRFSIEGVTLKVAGTLDYFERPVERLRIRATDTENLSIERILEIAIEPDAFRAWAQELPENHRNPWDDPSGIGIPNLLRYAFGMDPLQSDRTKLPRVGSTVAEIRGVKSSYLTIAYHRRKDDDRLHYFIDGSNDLYSWSRLLRPFTEVTDNGDGVTETVTVRDTQPINDENARFLRVRVER